MGAIMEYVYGIRSEPGHVGSTVVCCQDSASPSFYVIDGLVMRPSSSFWRRRDFLTSKWLAMLSQVSKLVVDSVVARFWRSASLVASNGAGTCCFRFSGDIYNLRRYQRSFWLVNVAPAISTSFLKDSVTFFGQQDNVDCSTFNC